MNELDDNTTSFWNSIYPREISFLKLPPYDHYRSKTFHARTTRGRWALAKIRQDFAAAVIRSDVYCDPSRPKKSREFIHRLLLLLDGDVFCYFEGGDLTVYAPTPEMAVEHSTRFLDQYQAERRAASARFYLLNARPGGFDVESVRLRRPAIMSGLDLALHYGADVVEFETSLIRSLCTRASGVVILRGEPGTGKTSFIRHLIAKLRKSHKFFVIPMAACRFLAGPDMVEFWLHQNRSTPNEGKVVVLEDAEELLMARGPDNQEKVSSLLNAADGLLGEFLNLVLVLTVNCDIVKLDPALTRPGRLMGMREFRRLNRSEAARLAKAKGLALPDRSDFSLAELYCGAVSHPALNADRQIGFAQ